MIARAGGGWQTLLADLSLILFMVMATAISEAPEDGGQLHYAEPVAQWRDVANGPDLAAWLAPQSPDLRLRLTIIAPPSAAQRAVELARGSGRPARIVLDPEAKDPPVAVLTYDYPTQELAQ